MSDPVPASAIYDASTDGRSVLTAADFAAIRALLSVYSTSQVNALIGAIDGLTSEDIDTLAEINAILTDADLASITYVDSGLSGKQATLVSGTNIKTVNSTSLLGSGDIVVSASPAGSNGQVQYNNAGSFGGAVAVVYATSGTHMLVTAQSASIVPICAKAAASQSANLIEAKTSSNSTVFSVDVSGWIRAYLYVESGKFIIGNAGNITLTSHSGGGSFNLLRFGDTTSSSPALKRSGTSLIARLSDDSADTNFKAAKLNLSNLPTADPHVVGDIWNDAGTLKISAG